MSSVSHQLISLLFQEQVQYLVPCTILLSVTHHLHQHKYGILEDEKDLLGVNSLCSMQDVHKEQPGKNTKEIISRRWMIESQRNMRFAPKDQLSTASVKKNFISVEWPYGLLFIVDELFTQRNVTFLSSPLMGNPCNWTKLDTKLHSWRFDRGFNPEEEYSICFSFTTSVIKFQLPSCSADCRLILVPLNSILPGPWQHSPPAYPGKSRLY